MQNQPEQETLDLNYIVSQLEDLVKLAIDCQDREVKDNVSILEINKQIQSLRMLVDQLHQSFNKTLENMDISQKDVAAINENMNALPPSERKLIATLKALETKCETARDEMYKSLQENRETLKKVSQDSKGEKTKTARRKDKFKGIGGKKGWLPS